MPATAPVQLMRPLRLRPLTGGEQAIAREMFGEAIALPRVRLLALPGWRRGFVPGPRLIVWPGAWALADLSRAPLRLQAVFVHELAHVWQAQRGVFLPLAKLRAGDSARSYAYDLARGPPFAALNIEQQAMVVEHAFLALRGAPAPHPPALYAEASAAWRTA